MSKIDPIMVDPDPTPRPGVPREEGQELGRDAIGCRAVMGDPKFDWNYCQSLRVDGSSYCESHRTRYLNPDQSRRAKSRGAWWIARTK